MPSGQSGFWTKWVLDQVVLDQVGLDETGLAEVAIPQRDIKNRLDPTYEIVCVYIFLFYW